MEHVHIAALRPGVDALDSKQLRAVVTLIWPYSSSQRQFALLLAEPELRLRRRKGQVRARFSATSARALAATGVGIGDEVVLGLHGAQFVQDGAVSTPGKSIDWELAYTQTVVVSVRRDGVEIAHVELVDAAPTPAPQSPVKRAIPLPRPIPQWSSPAFAKRARLSDGPFFEQPAFDPLADTYNDGHDKKRRRKSYRDWTAWTYTTRTPSPEKEDVDVDDDVYEALSSPSRRPQLPKTPISPSRTDPASIPADVQDDLEYVEETTVADSADGDTTVDDGELHKVYAPLSTSSERPQRQAIEHADGPLDSQYDFGGDTELNTEDEDEVADEEVSATEAATELEDEHEEAVEETAFDSEVEVMQGEPRVTEQDSPVYVEAALPDEASDVVKGTTLDETVPEVIKPAVVVEEAITITMPPPTLPALTTDFAAPRATDLLTPIGKEPSSPNLKAVDSATLPLPSPFPGEQASSYFEQILAGQQQAPLDGPATHAEPVADEEADYILENSFFSSISSSRARGLHQDHETAFTPLRFTFGMDGAGWSRPLELSSPPPEAVTAKSVTDGPSATQEEMIEPEESTQPEASEHSNLIEDATQSSLFGTFDGDITSRLRPPTESAEPEAEISQLSPEIVSEAAQVEAAEIVHKATNVTVLSSDVESDESEEEAEDAVMPDYDEEQESGEETEEDDDQMESESGQEEFENNEIDARQLPPLKSGELPEPEGTTVSIESEVEDEHFQPQTEDASVETQASTTISEVANLGSPSGDGSNDADEHDNAAARVEAIGESALDPQFLDLVEARKYSQQDDYDPSLSLTDEAIAPAQSEDPTFDEFVNMDEALKPTVVLSSSPHRHHLDETSIPDTYEEPLNLVSDEWEPQLGTDGPLPLVKDNEPGSPQMIADTGPSTDAQIQVPDPQENTVDPDIDAPDTQDDTAQPDVKMESVEDGSLDLTSQSQDVPQESATDSATELLIAVPQEGNKVGELQFKSVPATAPARNTRSKANLAASPSEEDGYVSRVSVSARRTRSKASFDSTDRDTTSPTQTRGSPSSTVTPTRTRDATQTSPYNLRSQSKQLSPDNGISASPGSVRKSSRKLARRDVDFDIVPSQAENRDLFGSIFDPSQELSSEYSQYSQGRYPDVGLVKDSEEDTPHSEGSLSTVQYSEDDGVRGLRDAAEVQHATPQLKPPPSFLQSQRQTRSSSRSMGQQSVVSPDQPQSPRRSPRLTRSTFSPTPSPRIVRTARAAAHVSSPIAELVEEKEDEEDTPKAKGPPTIYPVLPDESGGDIQSSPLAPASAQRSHLQDSNLLTPDDTQQTTIEAPLSFQARQPEASLLITPELTQQTSTSATLRSFDIPLPGVATQPAPHSPILRTSPRRKPAVTQAKSPPPTQQSPSAHQSSDAISASDDSATLVTKPNPPSIGLSTPLAYYTPLRDLIFFLNRSSQFHSSSNPDTLALCTSSSTAPSKATKGPRHWNTTLHITDLSIWPASRTVNIFRAYASALPAAEQGDVVLLRAFKVESRRREPVLRSADESSWCVWRYGTPVWGTKGGRWGEVKAREECKGPVVERGVGEWAEVERLRAWYGDVVKAVLEGTTGSEAAGEDAGVEVPSAD